MVDETLPQIKPQPLAIDKVHDKLWVTWQQAPAGTSLPGGYATEDEVGEDPDPNLFTYSGMLISGSLRNVESVSNTTWTSIPEDMYDHKGNYVINGSSESKPELDAQYNEDKYSFEWTALEDSIVFCWFTRGHEPNLDYNIEYIKLDGSLEITNNQVLAIVSGEVTSNVGGSVHPLHTFEYIRRKDESYTVTSTDGNAIISVVTLS